MFPRHERKSGKALIQRAEELLAQKRQQVAEIGDNAYDAALRGEFTVFASSTNK
jgi:hypothetical protein